MIDDPDQASLCARYRDRHGKLRRYVRRPGKRRVALPGLPGSPEFMEAYQDAMRGPVLQRRAPKTGTLGALATEFFGSTEFANLKPSSQATYRLALAPVLELDGHRFVRDLPADKARKIIQEIGVNRPAMANLTRASCAGCSRSPLPSGSGATILSRPPRSTRSAPTIPGPTPSWTPMRSAAARHPRASCLRRFAVFRATGR